MNYMKKEDTALSRIHAMGSVYVQYDALLQYALREDIGSGDLATDSLVSSSSQGIAKIVSKATGVVSGQWVAKRIFELLDSQCEWHSFVEDGQQVTPGECIASVKGGYRALLTGERTALNFMQRMGGIATLTHAFMQQLKGTKCRVVDTRKTVPGLRYFDKRAVLDGGGGNHRMGLYDLAMIKDNHIALAGGIRQAVESVRKRIPVYAPIEVEVKNYQETEEALACGVEIIMLDNMSIEAMRTCVERIAGRALVEASGNVTLERVASIATTGVDFVSVGALTHSVKAMDISMYINPEK